MSPRPRRKAVAEPPPPPAPRRVLLDTHAWLWWKSGDRRLGRRARDVIANADEVCLSAASVWEIAIKTAIGKLVLPDDVSIARELEEDGFAPLAISVAHAEAVRGLPPVHRDPFDRLLVAQAKLEDLTIVTADDVLARYGVAVTNARE